MSWYELLDIRKQARLEWQMTPGNGIIPPVACPNCGEPLLPGPTSGPAGVLYCKFDFWQYPKDWHKPPEPAGLFPPGIGSEGQSYPSQY